MRQSNRFVGDYKNSKKRTDIHGKLLSHDNFTLHMCLKNVVSIFTN